MKSSAAKGRSVLPPQGVRPGGSFDGRRRARRFISKFYLIGDIRQLDRNLRSG
jgi:hypothetical protein